MTGRFGSPRHLAYACLSLALPLSMAAGGCQRNNPLRFSITLPRAQRTAAADGRLLVMLSKDHTGEPRLQMREPRTQINANKNTAQVFQMFGIDVDGLKPDSAATLDGSAVGFPVESLAQIPPGEYTVQALLNVYETFHRKDGHVVRLSMDHWEGQVWRTKPGNLYSAPRKIQIDPAKSGTIALSLDKEIPPLPYPKETTYLRYVRIESKLLSDFWGRKIELGAWVLVPEGFDAHPDARYPLIVNPAHFNADFQAGSARFAPDPPDPKLKGVDLVAASMRIFRGALYRLPGFVRQTWPSHRSIESLTTCPSLR